MAIKHGSTIGKKNTAIKLSGKKGGGKKVKKTRGASGKNGSGYGDGR